MVFFRDEDENDGESGSEAEGSTASSNGSIPLLPLRDIVVFPHMVVPLFVGRAKSIQALEDAVEGGRELMLAAQRQAGDEDPTEGEIYDVGTLGKIIQLLRLPDGTVKVLVEGKSRARIDEYVSSEPYLRVKITVLEESTGDLAEVRILDAFCSHVAPGIRSCTIAGLGNKRGLLLKHAIGTSMLCEGERR